MQPTMCSRCGKNVAVIFITKLEGGTSKNEGLCLKCARELGIKPIDDIIKRMGISDEDLENLRFVDGELTGFSGSSHLTAVFKGLAGCTPKDYRRDAP